MDSFLASAFSTFDVQLGGLTISPNYITAFFIILLIFLLIFSFARMHRLFVHWSFKGGVIGVLLGILLTLTVEGFFVISGSTALTAVLGWKDAPKPIAKLLDESRIKLHDSVCEVENKENVEQTEQ